MKRTLSFLSILILFFPSNIFAQSTRSDTVLASVNYNKGKEYYIQMKYDTAFFLFQKASDIYLKYGLWDKYLYSEAEKTSCQNLKYNFNGAFEIINKAFIKTKRKVSENSPAYAYALFQKGKIFHNKNMPDSALTYYNKALKIRENLYKEDNIELAQSYYFLNKIYFSLYDFDTAMFYNEKALKILERLNKKNDLLTINILNDRGLIEFYMMHHRKAEQIFEHTLKLTQKKYGADNIENIYPLSYLGLIYQDLGDYDNAIKNQKEVLTLSIKNLGREHYYCGTAYQNLANAYNHKRENEIAVEYAKKAIFIFTKVFGKKSKDVADAIGNLGVIYTELKDFKNAEKYLNESLNLFKEIKGDSGYDVSRIYQSIGAMYQDAGDYKKSKEYSKVALEIKKKIHGPDHYSIGMIYQNLAINETFLKNYPKSLEYFKKAEPILIKNYGAKSVNVAILYNNLGDTYLHLRDIKKSMMCFQKATVLNHHTFKDTMNFFSVPSANGFYSWHDFFISIFSKANLLSTFPESFSSYSKKKCFEISLNHYKVCDTLVSQAKLFACSKTDKLLIASETSNIYKATVDVCIKLANLSESKAEKTTYLNQAFLYSEKNKASVLLEALSGAEAQKFAGIPSNLLKKEKNLQIDISYYKKLLAESPDSADELVYFNKLFKLNRKYDTLISIFENKYPKFHNLKYSGFKLKIPKLQKNLDRKTALISYFISDSSVYVYYISRKTYFINQVPKSSNFNKLLKTYRNNISNSYILQDAFISNNNKVAKEYELDAFKLYNILFPKEIKEQLKKRVFLKIKNLVIIPDGLLSTIPFEALLTKKYNKKWTNWKNTSYFSEMPFLLKDFNVSYSYSANLFYQTNPKTKEKPEVKNISDWLALAPVFNNNNISGANLRTRNLIEKNSKNQTEQQNTRTWLRDGKYISPLPGSEEETKSIYNIFESHNKKAILKTHQFANEEYVKSGALKNFRFLHIATHGMVNESKPELSCILLAQDTTSSEDNILYSGEIYNLELNADLTVLSACETGLGKFSEGEGVIGLTRALLYAGSKNIIVSLWQVSDASTNLLMVNFYKNLLNKEKVSFTHHLSKAKLKLIEDGKYAHPFFWSPFILIGK